MVRRANDHASPTIRPMPPRVNGPALPTIQPCLQEQTIMHCQQRPGPPRANEPTSSTIRPMPPRANDPASSTIWPVPPRANDPELPTMRARPTAVRRRRTHPDVPAAGTAPSKTSGTPSKTRAPHAGRCPDHAVAQPPGRAVFKPHSVNVQPPFAQASTSRASTSARVGTEVCAPIRVTAMAEAAVAKRAASTSDRPSESATANAPL